MALHVHDWDVMLVEDGCYYPAGAFRPTVIDKNWPIELIGSKLCDEKYEVVESADFHIHPPVNSGG